MHDEIFWAVTQVLRSPVRLQFLLSDRGRTLRYVLRFLRRIVPRASRQLREIQALASAIPDGRLRHEAQASASGKGYHVLGAGVLATFLPPAAAERYVELVAPIESIYDYLDNLCDRHPEVDPRAYPVLHRAIADALDPDAPLRDYYELGPSGDDGGYLRTLVSRSQARLRRIAGWERLRPYFAEAASFYAELQSYTHLPVGEREAACIAWYERNRDRFGELRWYEFACAAGSQFQVYGPLFELFAGRTEWIEATYKAYFPPVSALHVLFDSYIDQAEDREHGDLSFAGCYANESDLIDRVRYLAQMFKRSAQSLPDRDVHRFAMRIMTLFYLTHPKVAAQRMNAAAARLLRAADV